MHYLTRMTTQTTADVDVIIPLYNVERYIARALRSVLAQTLLPRRILVVNDGSTDSGADVVSAVQRSNTTPTEIIHLYKPNGGLSSARNHGIGYATAAYVAFLDADDLWEPTKLELQMACLEQLRPEPVAMVYCRSHAIDEEDRSIAGSETLGWEPLRGRVFDQLLRVNLISGSASAVVIRRTCLETVGGFDQQLSALEDIDLWLRIAQEGSIDLVEKDLVALRRHPHNMQKDTTHMLRNMIIFYRKWFSHGRSRPEVMKEWGHLIAEFALRANDPAAARYMATTAFDADQRSALFPRTFGSLGLYMLLKRLRAHTNAIRR